MSKGKNPFKGNRRALNLERAESPYVDINVTHSLEREQELPGAKLRNDTPDGSVREVLDWVNGDKKRAKQALVAEKLGSRRTTLLSRLQKVIGE